MKLAIYGAKSSALGVCCAVSELYPEHSIQCFLVTSKRGNPNLLAGLPVIEIKRFLKEFNIQDIYVLIGTPEDVQDEIIGLLKNYGFTNYICMNSCRISVLMERYFLKLGKFLSIHSLRYTEEIDKVEIQVFMAKFHRDKVLANLYENPIWIRTIQVGTALTEVRIADFMDNTGTNISEKNGNYCELTALYWMWKNKLTDYSIKEQPEYLGLFHYRRVLDITEQDQRRMKMYDVDVVLPFPTLHEPDIREHHVRYIKESDWRAMRQALEELQPEYATAFSKIERQPYLYNYNLILAKRQVLDDYCSWLFPILRRTEELSEPRGWERSDRYIGYLGESLMTLYFLFHQGNLKIFHTGCLMLT